MGQGGWMNSLDDRWGSARRSLVWIGALALAGLAGCAGNSGSQVLVSPSIATTSPANTPALESSAPLPSPSKSPSKSPSPLASPPSATVSPRPPQLTTVTLYTVDNQCNRLVPEPATVPADKPIEAAVGQLIDRQSNADFELAGYRVVRKPGSSQVTIDFRRAPNAKRSFVSLSTCEQLALFGSLQKTLTSNSAWGIKTVTFTEGGKEIIL